MIEDWFSGWTWEMAEGQSVLLFVLAALMFQLVVFVIVKRRARGQKKILSGAGISFLLIGILSFVTALFLKVS